MEEQNIRSDRIRHISAMETVEVPAIQHPTRVLGGNGGGEASDTEFWQEHGREICNRINAIIATGVFHLLVEYGNGNVRADRLEYMSDGWIRVHPVDYQNEHFMFMVKWYRPMTLLLGKRVFL